MSKKNAAVAKKQHINTTPVEISLADASILYDNYSNAAVSFSRIADVYKKVVDLEGSLIQKKAVKDPNAPKKPFTPYIQFCNEERDHIRKVFPNYTSQDVSRELGTAWKALNETEKEAYLKKYESENAAYKLELEEYNKHKLQAQENEDSSSEQPTGAIQEDSEESEEDIEQPVQKKAAPQNARKRKAVTETQAKKAVAAANPPKNEATTESAVSSGQTPNKKKNKKKQN